MNYHMLTEPYRSILNSLSEGVCAVNAQLSIGCFNLQAERLTGITAEHALGSNLKRVFPHDTKAWQKLVMDVLESMKPIRNIRKDLEKPSGERIPVTVNAAPVRDQKGAVTGVVLTFQDNSAIEILRRELRQECTYGDIVTRNSHMHQMLDILPHVAESDSTVLILGSTGTGKELFARAIHAASARSRGPFVAVNCGALPDNLLESELFGYKKGAFTDAKQDKPGRFALAEKGTLFLDEIGDLSPAMQVKLMRVLQEKEYEPLGAIKSETTDVRILAATNRDLIVMVKEGTFRPDLYYRLNVIEFVLPALVDRPEDIPLLVEHFVEVLNAEKGRDIARVSQTAMSWLMDYEYPGNIRELRNIIERAYVLCRYDEIREECLPSHLLENNPVRRSISTRHLSPSLQRMNAEEQENLIREVLIKHNMHRGRTAEELSIDRTTLWRKMKQFGITAAD